MSMHSYVVLLRDSNEPQYQKHLAVLLACKAADVDPPKVIDEYFGGYGIDSEPEAPLEIKWEPREWSDGDMSNGFEVDLDALPPGVKTIRFVNSW